jgi:histone-lysine N-methyltransferase SETMAR
MNEKYPSLCISMVMGYQLEHFSPFTYVRSFGRTYRSFGTTCCYTFFWIQSRSINFVHQQLVEAYHSHAPSRATVARWLHDFSEGRTSLEDEERSGRPKESAMEKEVEELVEEDPTRSNRDIAATIGISPTTVQRILHEELHIGRRPLKVVPYFLSPEQRAERVTTARLMLSYLNPLQAHHLPYLWTQDESWILFKNPPRSILTKLDEPRVESLRPTCHGQKVMISLIWNFDGLWAMTVLPRGKGFTRDFMINNVVADWEAVVKTVRPVLGVAGSLLHLDNAPTHKIDDELSKKKVTRIPQPPYSPDLSPCDFHLFGYIKEVLQGQEFDTVAQLRCQIDILMIAFNREARREVFRAWKARLERCIMTGGARVEE